MDLHPSAACPVTYSMGMSLDGYINDRDGGIGWTTPSPDLFRAAIEEIRGVRVHLMGRRLYETMRYWEDPAVVPGFDADEREWAALWNPLPKVVFSRTLTAVEGNARLATGTVAEEIARLRAEPGEGEIAIGGATLAAEAARAGLIDEYRPRILPVVLGGGTPFFPSLDALQDLELLERREFENGAVGLRYRVRR